MFKKFLALSVAAVMSVASFVMPVSAAGIPVAITNVTPMSVSVAPGGAAQVRVSTTVAANSVSAVYENKTAAGVMQSSTATAKEWLITLNPTMTQTATIYVGATAEVNALTVQYPISITVTGTAAAATPAASAYNPNAFNPNAFNPSASAASSYNPGYSAVNYNNFNPNVFTPSQSATAVTPAAPVAPTPAPPSVSITNISETSVGRTVTLTVSASSNANNVWVNFDRSVVDGGRYIQGTRSGNDWVIKFNPADTQQVDADVQEVIVSANTSYKTNGAANEEYNIEFTSSIAPPAEAQIISVSGTSSVYRNNSATLNITTNADAEFVWVKYNNNQTVNATNPRTSGTNKLWTVTFAPNASQSVTVYANLTNSEDGAKTRAYSISYSGDSQYGNAQISSVNADWRDDYDDYSNGDNAYLEVEVRTNSSANNVWIVYNNQTRSLYRTSSSSTIWRPSNGNYVSVDYRSSEDDIMVYVNDASSQGAGYDDSERVTIGNHSGSSNGNGDILSADPGDGDDVNSDSSLDIEVETDSDVEYVRIVRGTRNNYGRNEEDYDTSASASGSRHYFDLTVDTSEDDGKTVTFTIFAYENRNDDDDEYTDWMEIDLDVD